MVSEMASGSSLIPLSPKVMAGVQTRLVALRWIIPAPLVLDARLFMLVDEARENTLARARDTPLVRADVIGQRMNQHLAPMTACCLATVKACGCAAAFRSNPA